MRPRQKLVFNALFLLAMISGCAQVTQRSVEVSKDAIDIAVAMKDVDADKCTIMYKQFAGLSGYMKSAGKSVDTTEKLFKLISAFQKDYQYNGTSKDYTDAVEAFLMKQEYKYPMKIVDKVSDPVVVQVVELKDGTKSTVPAEVARDKIVSDMRILADAARIAIGKKNAK